MHCNKAHHHSTNWESILLKIVQSFGKVLTKELYKVANMMGEGLK